LKNIKRMEQTAMKELLELCKHYKATFQNPITKVIEKIELELLEKEKQQIKDAFNFGGEYNEEWDKAAEQYYDETYGN
jgi:hypothetical protein